MSNEQFREMFKKIALHRVFSDRFKEIDKEKREEVELFKNEKVDVLEFQLGLLDQIYKGETGLKDRIMTVCAKDECQETPEFFQLAKDAGNLIGLKDIVIAGKYIIAMYKHFLAVKQKEKEKAEEEPEIISPEEQQQKDRAKNVLKQRKA